MGRDAASLQTYRCTDCGYGASCRRKPERCPMCGGLGWEATGRTLDVTSELVAAARRAAARAGGDADAPLVRELAEVSVFPGVPLS